MGESVPPNALLRHSQSGAVNSFRQHVLVMCDRQNVTEAEARQRVAEFIASGDLLPVTDPAIEPSMRTFLSCGCTDEFSCVGGCEWYDTTLCSRCAREEARSRESVEAEINNAYAFSRENPSNTAIELARIQCELLLDIRDLLAAPIAEEESRLDILERIAARAESRLVTARPGLLL